MKKFFLSLAFLLGFNSNMALAQNEAVNPIVIKLSHTDRANSIKGKSAIRFKEMLEAKFPKRVKIDLYENGSLYKDNEELEALQLGVVNIIIPSSSSIAENDDVKELQLFDLPFLFSSNNDFKKVILGQTSYDLLNIINKKVQATQAIGYWSEGFRDFIGQQVFKTPQDFKNKIVTVSNLGVNESIYKEYGASKVIKVMPEENKEMFIATNKKADITQLSLNEYIESGLNDSLKVITESRHNYSTNIVMVNKKWFNTLPEDIKNGILEIVKNTTEYNLDLVNKSENDIKTTLNKSGITVYQWSEKEKEMFKKSVIPIHTKFLNEVNKELLLQTYQEIKNK